MLRDDAIRAGLIKPTKEDIERMNLTVDIPKEKEPVKTVKKTRKKSAK